MQVRLAKAIVLASIIYVTCSFPSKSNQYKCTCPLQWIYGLYKYAKGLIQQTYRWVKETDKLYDMFYDIMFILVLQTLSVSEAEFLQYNSTKRVRTLYHLNSGENSIVSTPTAQVYQRLTKWPNSTRHYSAVYGMRLWFHWQIHILQYTWYEKN